ncbi:hypothetical protein BT96DRAFT_1083478 [Gymnopus androsaceus JB14]|uniref:Uncharacterized protein n=1 Tax=Gymnopus androsaceus JB14 TaxID=1447944 RepID=A0A6A4GLM9_9AGAR|nr:hypothetical protein BT96DRAFT_1083478 [Gymnopus androsaceus JB14]
MKVEGAKAGLGKVSLDGDHLRGRFPVYNCRTTMGMGKMKPLILRLVGDRAVIRMAQYQNCKLLTSFEVLTGTKCFLISGCFSLWAPRIYAEYVHVRDAIRSVLSSPKNSPTLGGNFISTIVFHG